MDYTSIRELISLAKEKETTISEIVLQVEMDENECSREDIIKRMKEQLQVMHEAIASGLHGELRSASGLVGGEASKIKEFNLPFSTGIYQRVISNAVATAEVNACMGKIVAGPTAGSSGVVPAVVLALEEELSLDEDKLAMGLITAAGLGGVVARKATLAGAAGGCQAECGVASAMAAGAAVELCGGCPEMVGDAFALALKNLLGLVCDPVAGLVEVPCVKRNGFAASHALTAVTMVLSGVKSVIPPDEVIDAMSQVGDMMSSALKETALGGLATTPTGMRIKEKLEKGK